MSLPNKNKFGLIICCSYSLDDYIPHFFKVWD